MVLAFAAWPVAQPVLFNHPADGVFLDVLGKQVLSIEGGIEIGKAGLVPHQVGNGYPILALGSKLGPVLSDSRVVLKQTPADQSADGNGLQALATAENIHQGIRREGLITSGRCPQVDHFLSAVVDTQLGVLLCQVAHLLRKQLFNRLETLRYIALHLKTIHRNLTHLLSI